MDIPLPAIRICRVRLGLNGAVLADRFDYYVGWKLRLFKEVLLGVFGPSCRFDIVKGAEKWRSYVHEFAADVLEGVPGEEIQIIFMPHPDSVMTDPAVADETAHWDDMWSAIAKDRNYMFLENGDCYSVPGCDLILITCTVCGTMGLYSTVKNGIRGTDAEGCPIFYNRFKHRYTGLGQRLSFCELCKDAELPGWEPARAARHELSSQATIDNLPERAGS